VRAWIRRTFRCRSIHGCPPGRGRSRRRA
jgi:hypothetical protein